MKRSCRFWLVAGVAFTLICCGLPIGFLAISNTISDWNVCRAAVSQIATPQSADLHPISELESPEQQLLPITAANADHVQELTRLGRGYIKEAFWSDASDLMVITSIGLWRHDHENWETLPLLVWTYTTGPNEFAVSSDGTLIAVKSTSHPATIPLWSAETGEQIISLQAQGSRSGALETMAFSPDGTMLAAAIGDNVHLWDTTTGTELRVFTGFTGLLDSLAFSSDGTRLAAGGSDSNTEPEFDYDGVIRIWDIESGSLLRIMQIEEAQGVESLAFNPDNSVLASGGEFWDRNLRSWDVSTGIELNRVESPYEYSLPLAFSPDGEVLAHGGRLLNPDTGNLILEIGDTYQIVFSRNGDSLAALGERIVVGTWTSDVFTETAILPWYSPVDVRGLRFNPQGVLRESIDNDNSAQNIVRHPDGKTVIHITYGASSPSYIRICDTTTGDMRLEFESDEGMNNLVFSPDGTMFAINEGQGKITFYNATTYEEMTSFDVREGRRWAATNQLAFNRDGTVLVFAMNDYQTGDHSIRLWDVHAHKQLAILPGHTSTLFDLIFNEDSTLLASSSADGTIRLWGIPAA